MIIVIEGDSVIIYWKVSGKKASVETGHTVIEISSASGGKIIRTSSFIPTELRPDKAMFGFFSYEREKEAIFPMRMKLDAGKEIDITTLTIVADNDSITISQ